MKSLTRFAGVWFVLLCLLFVFYPAIADKVWMFYFFIHWGFVAVGGILVIAALARWK